MALAFATVITGCMLSTTHLLANSVFKDRLVIHVFNIALPTASRTSMPTVKQCLARFRAFVCLPRNIDRTIHNNVVSAARYNFRDPHVAAYTCSVLCEVTGHLMLGMAAR